MRPIRRRTRRGPRRMQTQRASTLSSQLSARRPGVSSRTWIILGMWPRSSRRSFYIRRSKIMSSSAHRSHPRRPVRLLTAAAVSRCDFSRHRCRAALIFFLKTKEIYAGRNRSIRQAFPARRELAANKISAVTITTGVVLDGKQWQRGDGHGQLENLRA